MHLKTTYTQYFVCHWLSIMMTVTLGIHKYSIVIAYKYKNKKKYINITIGGQINKEVK